MTRLGRIAAGEEVFGPSVDALVRRALAAGRSDLEELVETWPEGDPEGLRQRLTALLDEPPGDFASGTPERGILDGVLGALAGVPAGLFAYLILRNTYLPFSLWPSVTLKWVIVALVALACGWLGARRGLHPSLDNRVLFRSLLGFVIGLLVAAPATIVTVLALGQARGVSAASSLGIAFTFGPMIGFVAGVALTLWMGFRAARRKR